MSLLEDLREIWAGSDSPFMVGPDGQTLAFQHVDSDPGVDLSAVQAGDVVGLIGDFDALSVQTFLRLIDRKAIVVPLSTQTRTDHDYFFGAACVNVVIEGEAVRHTSEQAPNPLLGALREQGHAGIVLFSTGTTGRPKAILHDWERFGRRFRTPRPALRTLNFLMFDHIGGVNTLLHTLYNRGLVIVPAARTVAAVLEAARVHRAELLPTTPTFLRMLLLSGLVPDGVPDTLRLITYGTERMDQATLSALCNLLPQVDFRQTYGMSELGILRVRSRARDSLFMEIGGEGVDSRVVDGVLQIRAENRMLGYLNAEQPFDEAGWYNTHDLVQQDAGSIRIVGRDSDAINVGGVKFHASDVEQVAVAHPQVELVKVSAGNNPISGQHVEILIQPVPGAAPTVAELRRYFRERLPTHMVPRRIRMGRVEVSHRLKRL